MLADYLSCLDLSVVDELGYLPFAQTDQLLFHPDQFRPIIVTTNLVFADGYSQRCAWARSQSAVRRDAMRTLAWPSP